MRRARPRCRWPPRTGVRRGAAAGKADLARRAGSPLTVLVLVDGARAGRRSRSVPGAAGGSPADPMTCSGRCLLRGPGGSESLTTVLVAFGANVLVAVAKSAAAMVTGSASLVAEAAHSWADAGNEIFLLIANRRSRRPPDLAHPFGHGREAYVWSLFAAVGLFVAGAAVSVTHGIQELIHPEPAEPLRRRVRRAGRVVRPGGNLVPAVGPAGQTRGRVDAAGSDRARDGHLGSHSAGGVCRGLGRPDRLGHRGGRAGRPPADRVGGAGRRRVDPGRRAARRRRGGADQP